MSITVVSRPPGRLLRDKLALYVGSRILCRLTLHELRFLHTIACVRDHHEVAHIEEPAVNVISHQAHLAV